MVTETRNNHVLQTILPAAALPMQWLQIEFALSFFPVHVRVVTAQSPHPEIIY